MHLRCELRGHEEDVRGLCVCPLGLVSSSRDKSIRIWKETSGTSFEEDKVLIGHTDYVGTLAWMPPGVDSSFPTGGLVSGSRDNTIIVWDTENGVAMDTLKGHDYQVSSIAIMEDGAIVSASLDKSLKVWKSGKEVATLNGHEGPVLSVLVLPEGYILSGSGDKTLKVWKDGQMLNTLKGHADTVRDLALYPSVGVVSASHDHTLRVWTLDSNCVGQLVGHSALVYSCATSENGLIASELCGLIQQGSEDNTARVWRGDGTLVVTLKHPGCVWAVAFLPNEDLVTGCADGIVRIWSTSDDRKASQEVMESLEASIVCKEEEAASTSKGSLPPGLNAEDASALLSPGTRDGQHKIIREGDGAVVYGWSVEKGEWEKIGDVMGNESGEMTVGAQNFHNGRSWDYVFDVDVQDGAPMLKLCMNIGDDPYLVAERFLMENQLPVNYLDQIIQFIMAKTEHMPPPVDPLTGGYSAAPASGPSTFSGDPFDLNLGNGLSSRTRLHHSPKKSSVYFDMVRPLDPMVAKIKGFSSELCSDDANQSLSEEEASGLESLVNGAIRSAKGEASGLVENDYVLLQKLLKFPHQKLFPALDLCRMIALDITAQGRLAAMAGDLTSEKPGVLGACILNSDSASGFAANQQMAIQLLANCFKHPNLKAWILNNWSIIIEKFSGCCTAMMNNTRQALSTMILNLAVESHVGKSVGRDRKEQGLGTSMQILLETPPDDHETRFRALVAAGTLMYEDPALQKVGKEQGILDLAQEKLKVAGVPSKLKNAVADLESLLA